MNDTARVNDAQKASFLVAAGTVARAGSMETPSDPMHGGRPLADAHATASSDTASIQLANAPKLLSPGVKVCIC